MQLDWGTVPAFLSLAVSAWALYESKKNSRSEKKDKVREQARLVVVEPLRITDLQDGRIRVQSNVENLSEHPVSESHIYAFSQLIAEESIVWETLGRIDSRQRVALDVITSATQKMFPLPGDDRYRVNVSFTDINGYKWSRWANGEVTAPISLRAKSRLVKVLWRVLPGRLVIRWQSRKNRPPVRGQIPKKR